MQTCGKACTTATSSCVVGELLGSMERVPINLLSQNDGVYCRVETTTIHDQRDIEVTQRRILVMRLRSMCMFIAFVCSISNIAYAANQEEAVRKVIDSLIVKNSQYISSQTRPDIESIMSYYRDDITAVISGEVISSKAALKNKMENDFNEMDKALDKGVKIEWKEKIELVKLLSPDTALAFTRVKIFFTHDNETEQLESVIVYVLSERDGEWKIVMETNNAQDWWDEYE